MPLGTLVPPPWEKPYGVHCRHLANIPSQKLETHAHLVAPLPPGCQHHHLLLTLLGPLDALDPASFRLEEREEHRIVPGIVSERECMVTCGGGGMCVCIIDYLKLCFIVSLYYFKILTLFLLVFINFRMVK